MTPVHSKKKRENGTTPPGNKPEENKGPASRKTEAIDSPPKPKREGFPKEVSPENGKEEAEEDSKIEVTQVKPPPAEKPRKTEKIESSESEEDEDSLDKESTDDE